MATNKKRSPTTAELKKSIYYTRKQIDNCKTIIKKQSIKKAENEKKLNNQYDKLLGKIKG